MNENRILTLLPWSAAGPITRAAEGSENWFFRVSVDDSKSGEFFIREAVDRQGCSRMALVLLESGWGRSGEMAISKALEQRGQAPAIVRYFPFSVGEATAGALAREVAQSGADCAVLMANAGNGVTVIHALNAAAPELRVFSHWGILGADFADHVSHETRQAIDLQVLQTCALRIEAGGSEVLKRALALAAPGSETVAEVGAVTGFVHGYDLTRILIAAAAQAADSQAWAGNIQDRRTALKAALQDLDTPVSGILKRYERPFSPWDATDANAHEALGLDDLCFARFGEDGLLQDAG